MNDRRLTVAGVVAILTLLIGLVYVIPRRRALARLEKETQELRAAQTAVDKLLPEAIEQVGNVAPNPKPDVPGWLQSNALGGLERRLINNNPYRSGQGANLKLRSLKPVEVSNLLGTLTRVNVIVKRLVLSDVTARGLWDLDLDLEIPSPPSSGGDKVNTGDKP